MFISNSAAETEEAGARFAKELRAGDVLALSGELGSGKTQFVKGIARGLDCAATVTSPTFTLVHEYLEGRLPLYHFDFYRLESADALRSIDFDEYVSAAGVCVVEWADKFPTEVPSRTCWIRFDFESAEARTIEFGLLRLPLAGPTIEVSENR